MALVVTTDRGKTLGGVEDFGALTQMRREYLVSGLTSTDPDAIMEALDAAAVPEWGDFFTGSTSTMYDNMSVNSREFTLEDNSTIARVTVSYTSMAGEGQDITGLADIPSHPTGALYAVTSTSLNQVQTNLDKNNNAIVVKYTYPADHEKKPGKIVNVGGTVQVLVPQTSATIEGIIATDSPSEYTINLVGKIGTGDSFLGQFADQWMCTGATCRLSNVGITPKEWKVAISFQLSDNTAVAADAGASGWQQRAVYVDPDTGQPPSDVAESEHNDSGITTVNVYKTANFYALFGRVDGV